MEKFDLEKVKEQKLTGLSHSTENDRLYSDDLFSEF